jgi:hypothetical protein
MATTKKTAIPADAIVVDLNESKRARAEADGAKPIYIKFGKRSYRINREIPLTLILSLGEIDEKDQAAASKLAVETCQAFLGEDGWKTFLQDGATVPDMFDLFNAAFAAITGVTPGEAGASATPSRTSGTRPRRRSKPATASTS